jgi:hypothetical protein
MTNTKSVSTAGLARQDEPLNAADPSWSMCALTRKLAHFGCICWIEYSSLLSLAVPRLTNVKQVGVRPMRRLDARDR